MDTTITTTDHHPVTTTINIPTNPLNIYHIPRAEIHYRPLNKSELNIFSNHLAPLNDWAKTHSADLLTTSTDTIVDITNNILNSLVNAYKKTSNQGHTHKPTKPEKDFLHHLSTIHPSGSLSPSQANALQHSLNQWTDKETKQAQKRLHSSLVKGHKIKKSINNILQPRSSAPMALYDINHNLTSDPYSLCESMGQCLTSLGGPTDFQTDPQLIDSLMQDSPKISSNAPQPQFTESFFNTLLSDSNPTKAPGFDNTNLYLFHIAPSHIKHLLFLVCNYFITHPEPRQWLTARIFLLYKKGDPHEPINYRPIALLKTIYKILASYAATSLTFYATQYKLLHHTQYGGIPNHRTTDHIYSMISNISLHPDIYHLYLDLNKAFNSVPHSALWQILNNYNFPTHLITLIQHLYSHPADYPSINGFSLFAAMTLRGLRQGCPMSPILFNLFIDPILRQLDSILPKQPFRALFSFIDDIALQTTSISTIHTALSFLFTIGPKYGLSFNASKSELHALKNSPHVTIRISSTLSFSTCNPDTNQPRSHYKYLGVYFFNNQQNKHMLLLLNNTITSFFTNLLSLHLSHTELIKLANCQLISTLAYRLNYNSLPNESLDTLDHSIWKHIAYQGKLSKRTPNKTKYSPRHTFGLGITKLSQVTHTQTVNHCLRYTLNEGPSTANKNVQHALFHPSAESNLIQTMFTTSAHHFSIQTHNIPHSNPCLLRDLPVNTTIEASFHTSPNLPPTWHPGKILQHNPKTTTVQFSDMTCPVSNSHSFRFPIQPATIIFPFLSLPQAPLHPTSLQSFPLSYSTYTSTNSYLCFHSNQTIRPPNNSHLDFWGCHDLLQHLQQNQKYTLIYTDGSDDPSSSLPSGSAAVITHQPNHHTILTNLSPIKGSYPAEIYSIITTLFFPNLPSLQQPIIFAIDNLSVCTTLNFLQPLNHPPFSSHTNSFALWYNLIWHLLQRLRHLNILFTWIKGHAGFPRNDTADSIAKWITLHLSLHITPSSSTTLALQQTPLPGKITTKHTKHKLPTHEHNNIHLSLSNKFFLKASWFSTFIFKWVNGLYCCKGYKPHFILNKHLCPKCNTHHPLDPITFITTCSSTTQLRQLLFNTWTQPFKTTILSWWTTATSGDKRNFIRTLIPNSLSNLLRTPPQNSSYHQHAKNLDLAFKQRQKPLQKAIYDIKQWLHDNPIPNIQSIPASSPHNPWNEHLSIYSTSSTHPCPLTFPKPTNNQSHNKHPHKRRPTALSTNPSKPAAIQLHVYNSELHPQITNYIPPPQQHPSSNTQ